MAGDKIYFYRGVSKKMKADPYYLPSNTDMIDYPYPIKQTGSDLPSLLYSYLITKLNEIRFNPTLVSVLFGISKNA